MCFRSDFLQLLIKALQRGNRRLQKMSYSRAPSGRRHAASRILQSPLLQVVLPPATQVVLQNCRGQNSICSVPPQLQLTLRLHQIRCWSEAPCCRNACPPEVDLVLQPHRLSVRIDCSRVLLLYSALIASFSDHAPEPITGAHLPPDAGVAPVPLQLLDAPFRMELPPGADRPVRAVLRQQQRKRLEASAPERC